MLVVVLLVLLLMVMLMLVLVLGGDAGDADDWISCGAAGDDGQTYVRRCLYRGHDAFQDYSISNRHY
jgi:hypothetical protein